MRNDRSQQNPATAPGPADEPRVTRRRLLAAGAAGTLSGALGGALAGPAGTAHADTRSSEEPPPGGGRILLRGATVLTMDPSLGDFERADVLIEGERIAAIEPDLEAEDAAVVDARGMIVTPGFIDTHRHMWQGQLRNVLPNGRLSDYGEVIIGTFRPHYRPEDVYIGNRISALGAIHAGVTTVLDWSHIGTSPAHSDAAIEALRDSGLRAVYGYGGGAPGEDNRFPEDLRRLRTEHFSSDDQRLTLALATGLSAEHWALARELDVFITTHVNGTNTLLPAADRMGPDNAYIHCCNLSEEEWRLIADTGGGVSIAGPIEMQMGHGVPPFQQAIDHGIPISLSNDVETSISGEFFTQMRAAFGLQRMLVYERERAGESNTPELLTVREVLEMATLGGARVNHLEDRTGTLTPGKRADILVLDPNTVTVLPLNDACGAVVLSMDTANVRHVFIDGQPKKWNGRLLDVDLQRLRDEAADSQEHLYRSAGLERRLV